MFDKVFQGLILATAVSIPLAVFNGTLFSWHPTLMSIGFLGFMGNGVLTAFQFRHVMDANARVKAIQKHALWQLAAVFCIGSGFYAIYQNKVPFPPNTPPSIVHCVILRTGVRCVLHNAGTVTGETSCKGATTMCGPDIPTTCFFVPDPNRRLHGINIDYMALIAWH